MSAGDWKRFYQAVCDGDLPLVQHYVNAGIDVNYAHPEFFSTPLVAAMRGRQEEVALYLLRQGADPLRVSEVDGAAPVDLLGAADFPRLEEQLRAIGATARPRKNLWKRWLGW
jgi:uncharacterized protein